MEYRRLGKTEIEVAKICLGTMTYGEQNTEAEAHEQLDYALDHGVNFIDTAELYAVPSTSSNNGKTEDYIGTWVKDRGRRDDYILATKVAGPSPNLKYISDNLGYSRERITEAVEGSLRRLQTDYIDLYQLHWPERKTNYFGKLGYVHDASDPWQENFDEVVSTLSELQQAGKIRHWGLSNETPWGTMRWLEACDRLGANRPVSIQNPYNLLDRAYDIGTAEVSHRESIGLLAYSPLAFGVLSGKYHRGEDTPASRLNKYKKQMGRYDNERGRRAVASYQKIADEAGLSLTQMSLAYVNETAFVTSNIIGATSMQQLEENIKSADVKLSKEVLRKIEAVHKDNPNPPRN
jgi:aryl-alcohol dehydrogenase-like predicted oxidoreductase